MTAINCAPHSHRPPIGLGTAQRALCPATPNEAEKAVDWVVSLGSGTAHPLFCVCAGGGDPFGYLDLAAAIEGHPIVAFGLPPVADNQGFPTVQQLAAIYVREARRRQSQGPYHLCGHSFGGLVAYEMAVLLAAQGETVGFVGLIDALHPGFKSAMSPASRRQFRTVYLGDRILKYGHNLAHGRIDLIASDISEFVRGRSQRMWWWIVRSVFGRFGQPVPSAIRNDSLVLFSARRGYSPSSYAGRLVLLNAVERSPEYSGDDSLGWRTCASGPIDVHSVPGDHRSIMHSPEVHTLAERIRPYLAGCRGG
jgi:thioesterase domain-containing protein